MITRSHQRKVSHIPALGDVDPELFPLVFAESSFHALIRIMSTGPDFGAGDTLFAGDLIFAVALFLLLLFLPLANLYCNLDRRSTGEDSEQWIVGSNLVFCVRRLRSSGGIENPIRYARSLRKSRKFVKQRYEMYGC